MAPSVSAVPRRELDRRLQVPFIAAWHVSCFPQSPAARNLLAPTGFSFFECHLRGPRWEICWYDNLIRLQDGWHGGYKPDRKLTERWWLLSLTSPREPGTLHLPLDNQVPWLQPMERFRNSWCWTWKFLFFESSKNCVEMTGKFVPMFLIVNNNIKSIKRYTFTLYKEHL